MNTTERLLVIEPFYTGSHKLWADSLVEQGKGSTLLYSLPGRNWKWRMHEAAIRMAERFDKERPDVQRILVTDMLDLATFKGLCRELDPSISISIYFHENQLTYPWSSRDQDRDRGRDNHYAFINFTSCLAADEALFNSQFHLDSFIGSLPEFLAQFPDVGLKDKVDEIRSKCELSYMKIPLSEFAGAERIDNDVPHVLWNHRWEFDKNPDEFFRALMDLSEENVRFNLIVTGESFTHSPPIFAEAEKKLAPHIVHWGYVPDRKNYIELLLRSDLLPVTSNQEFFGISVVEAIAAGVRPLLPRRLSYPELIEGPYFYKGSLVDDLRAQLISFKPMEVYERQSILSRFGQ